MDELRLYSRYSLIFPQVGRLKIYDNNQVGTILNLSYGGLLVNFEDPWNQEIGPHDNTNFNAELDLLGQKTPANLQFVHNVNHQDGYTGFSFQHRNVETLVFLREIVENFRIGSSLRQLPSELTLEKYRSQLWRCFRGEGPTDITQMGGTTHPTKEVKVSFRDGSSHCDLQYKDGDFTSERTINLDGTFGTLVDSGNKQLDSAIFHRAIQILVGASSNDQTKYFAKPLLDIALKKKLG